MGHGTPECYICSGFGVPAHAERSESRVGAWGHLARQLPYATGSVAEQQPSATGPPPGGCEAVLFIWLKSGIEKDVRET